MSLSISKWMEYNKNIFLMINEYHILYILNFLSLSKSKWMSFLEFYIITHAEENWGDALKCYDHKLPNNYHLIQVSLYLLSCN